MNFSLSKFNRSPSSRGFTLVEMLVVIAVIAVVIATTTAGMGGMVRAMGMTNAGTKVTNLVEIARQRAMSRNVLTALVVVTNLGIPEDGRAWTILEYPVDGPWQQAHEWELIPDGYVIDLSNPATSSFVSNTPETFRFASGSGVPADIQFQGKSLPSGTYGARIFLPSGSLLDSATPAQLQIVDGSNSGGTTTYSRPGDDGRSANYYRITILGATGRTKVERPMLP